MSTLALYVTQNATTLFLFFPTEVFSLLPLKWNFIFTGVPLKATGEKKQSSSSCNCKFLFLYISSRFESSTYSAGSSQIQVTNIIDNPIKDKYHRCLVIIFSKFSHQERKEKEFENCERPVGDSKRRISRYNILLG